MVWVAMAMLTVDWDVVVGVTEVEGSVMMAEVELDVVNEVVDTRSVVVDASVTGLVRGGDVWASVMEGRTSVTVGRPCLGTMRLKR